MGAAGRWLKGLFGIKTKKKCSRKEKEKDHSKSGFLEDENARKRAIAAATAVVVEAAVAAAHAAAAVVKLTTIGKDDRDSNTNVNAYPSSIEWAAAITIQSRFRGYLSRRALRALKSLVRLQALVRGYLVRKQTAQFLQRLQTLVRVQAKICDCRSFSSELGIKNSSYLKHLGPETPEKSEYRSRSMKHAGPLCPKKSSPLSTGSQYYDDERNVKILEVDTGIPRTTLKSRRFIYPSYYNCTKRDRTCKSFSMSKETTMSPSGEVQSLGLFEYDHYTYYYDEEFDWSRGKSSRKGLNNTPTKSDGMSYCQSGYIEHPTYMAYTESSKAKVRSFSVPKQRYQPLERSNSTMKRYNAYDDVERNRGIR